VLSQLLPGRDHGAGRSTRGPASAASTSSRWGLRRRHQRADWTERYSSVVSRDVARLGPCWWCDVLLRGKCHYRAFLASGEGIATNILFSCRAGAHRYRAETL